MAGAAAFSPAVLLRYAAGLVAGSVVLLLLVSKRGEFVAAWHQLGAADLRWVGAAVGAEALSLLTFAWLQHRVLRLSGTRIGLAGLFALTLANDAIPNTVPGEPAVSSAYRYRFYRRRGAAGASAEDHLHDPDRAGDRHVRVLLAGVIVALAPSERASAGALPA